VCFVVALKTEYSSGAGIVPPNAKPSNYKKRITAGIDRVVLLGFVHFKVLPDPPFILLCTLTPAARPVTAWTAWLRGML